METEPRTLIAYVIAALRNNKKIKMVKEIFFKTESRTPLRWIMAPVTKFKVYKIIYTRTKNYNCIHNLGWVRNLGL
jgi:hypothetical protein